MALIYQIETSYSSKNQIYKINLTKLEFRQFYQMRKLELQGVFVVKDPDLDPVFSRIWIRVTQKDRIRPDPNPQHWSLQVTFLPLLFISHEL